MVSRAAPSSKVDLEQGTIEYEDSGGDGPALVLIGGLAMDWRLWGAVIDELGDGFRCIAPNMPLGSHRIPMKESADLSLRGMGRIVSGLIEALDLRDATLVFNDWSCGQTMIADVVGHRQIWVSPLSGEPYTVFAFEDPDIRIDYPVWSPDGRWLLFDRVKPEGGDVWLLERGKAGN